jgi:hypothetical protein
MFMPILLRKLSLLQIHGKGSSLISIPPHPTLLSQDYILA